MIRRGEEWGLVTDRAPDLVVSGNDAALAAAAVEHPGAVIAFEPTAASGLAMTLGITGGKPTGSRRLVAVDLLEVSVDGRIVKAANAVVAGRSPTSVRWRDPSRQVVVEVDGRVAWDSPATGVVVANGQYLDGSDVVPRGHPGDGRLEVQVYGVRRPERAELRKRVARGDHLPHPRIVQRSGRRVAARFDRPAAVTIDGVRHGRARLVEVEVDPGALQLITS